MTVIEIRILIICVIRNPHPFGTSTHPSYFPMTSISHSSSPSLPHTSSDNKAPLLLHPSDVHSTNHPTDRPTAGPCLSSLRPVSPTRSSNTRYSTPEQRRSRGSRYLQRAAADDQRVLLARRNVKRLMRSSKRLTLSRPRTIGRSD